jgi:hypothetical protein
VQDWGIGMDKLMNVELHDALVYPTDGLPAIGHDGVTRSLQGEGAASSSPAWKDTP